MRKLYLIRATSMDAARSAMLLSIDLSVSSPLSRFQIDSTSTELGTIGPMSLAGRAEFVVVVDLGASPALIDEIRAAARSAGRRIVDVEVRS